MLAALTRLTMTYHIVSQEYIIGLAEHCMGSTAAAALGWPSVIPWPHRRRCAARTDLCTRLCALLSSPWLWLWLWLCCAVFVVAMVVVTLAVLLLLPCLWLCFCRHRRARGCVVLCCCCHCCRGCWRLGRSHHDCRPGTVGEDVVAFFRMGDTARSLAAAGRDTERGASTGVEE